MVVQAAGCHVSALVAGGRSLTCEVIPYVERLAERIAGFPETAVRIAKRRINAAGLPPKEDVHVDSGFFQALARDPSTMARIRALMQRGMQERSRTEPDFGEAVGEL
ncbi:hypothetical protein AB0478_48590 [Streptomyces sp. NPDC051917]|uniref:hypothetical protein n=1 Tax=Streptomyces sp. NPDC051917 TaxID=3154754 RepID=UPI0034539D80